MKAKHALIHDTSRWSAAIRPREPRSPANTQALPLTTVKNSVPRNHSNKRLEKICREIYLSLILRSRHGRLVGPPWR
jgi:hypothetical protein